MHKSLAKSALLTGVISGAFAAPHQYVLTFLPDRPGFAGQQITRVLTLA